MIPFCKDYPSIHHFSVGCNTSSDSERDLGAGALETWGQPLVQIVRCVIWVSRLTAEPAHILHLKYLRSGCPCPLLEAMEMRRREGVFQGLVKCEAVTGHVRHDRLLCTLDLRVWCVPGSRTV